MEKVKLVKIDTRLSKTLISFFRKVDVQEEIRA